LSDLLNILSHSNKDIDNQKLMDYLSGKLSGTDKHEVEKWMIDNEFASEAVEGLQNMGSKKDLNAYVEQLNKELNQYLDQKKKRRDKRKLTDVPWSYFAILVILILVVVAYFIIRELGNNSAR
jgi:hypothetical protein